MQYHPAIHDRRSVRLAGFDYSRPGTYFVTVCTQNKECLFGSGGGGKVALNAAGELVRYWWGELAQRYSDIFVDEYVVMPNHVHGILVLWGRGGPMCPPSVSMIDFPYVGPFLSGAVDDDHGGTVALWQMIRWFKTMSTNQFMRGVAAGKFARVPGRLWQRSFHDRIVRNGAEHALLRDYIRTNPLRWGSE